MDQVLCKQCGETFKAFRSQIKIGKAKFCSRNCSTQSKFGRTPWNAGRTKDSDPRVAKFAKTIQKAFRSGKRSAWSKGLTGEKHPFYGRKLPRGTRVKIGEGTTGKRHWNWKGGITDKVHALRNRMLYQEWRQKVLAKNGRKCRECDTTTKLHCHHLKSFTTFPKLRYSVDNGVILCITCHAKEHNRLKENKKIYGRSKTK